MGDASKRDEFITKEIYKLDEIRGVCVRIKHPGCSIKDS